MDKAVMLIVITMRWRRNKELRSQRQIVHLSHLSQIARYLSRKGLPRGT